VEAASEEVEAFDPSLPWMEEQDEQRSGDL
jgi:hypothetical protein